MMQSGAILGPIKRSLAPRPTPGGPVTPVHDLNVPYEGTEEYETPTADMLFPPTPLQTHIQTPLPGSGQTPLPRTAHTPLPGTADRSLYNILTGGTPFTPGEYSNGNGGVSDMKAGNLANICYLEVILCLFLLPEPPSPWMNQRPPLDVNVAYDECREEVDRGASREAATQNVSTNLVGSILCTREAMRVMGDQDKGGHIFNMDGAGSGGTSTPLTAVYGSTKCGLKQLQSSLLKGK